MTSDMCGIETDNEVDAVPCRGASEGRWETTARLRAIARRVPPLQGGVGLVGPGSQGVALGCRVAAPLARMPTGAAAVAPGAMDHLHGMRSVLEPEELSSGSPGPQPEGLSLISPGKRPGNSASHKLGCPERATRGPGHAQRHLEQTIAGNVAEILET